MRLIVAIILATFIDRTDLIAVKSIERRTILRFNLTRHPTAKWTAPHHCGTAQEDEEETGS